MSDTSKEKSNGRRRRSRRNWVIAAVVVAMGFTILGIVLGAMSDRVPASGTGNSGGGSGSSPVVSSQDSASPSTTPSPSQTPSGTSPTSGGGASAPTAQTRPNASAGSQTAPTASSGDSGTSSPVSSDGGSSGVVTPVSEEPSHPQSQTQSVQNGTGVEYVGGDSSQSAQPVQQTQQTQSSQAPSATTSSPSVEPPTLERAAKEITFEARHDYGDYHAHDGGELNAWEDGYYVCQAGTEAANVVCGMRAGDVVHVDGMTCVVERVIDTEPGRSFEATRKLLGWDVVVFHTASSVGSGRIRLVSARPSPAHEFGVWYQGKWYSRQDWLSG